MRADVAVIGAGSAGAAVALLAARRGLKVVCVEQRALAAAGAHWVNDVPLSAFEESGIGMPCVREALGSGGRHHLFAGRGHAKITVPGDRTVQVDMRRLVPRLHACARDAGVVFVDRVRVLRVEEHALVTTAGPIHAEHVVDASGLSGAALLGETAREASALCVAAQAVHAVRDLVGARAYFEAHGASEGDTVAFCAIHGGFSMLSARLLGDRVAIFAGAVPADGHPTGRTMARRFASEQPWVGAACFGGARAIPLGGVRRSLFRGSIALLGDAAGQVFPALARGVGPGLVAARLLADALADGSGVKGYARAWDARFGRIFSFYARVASLWRLLGPDELAVLMRAGVIDEEAILAALEQRLPQRSAARLLALARAPAAIARVAWSVVGRSWEPLVLPSAMAGTR